MKKKITEVLGGIFFIVGIILLFSIAGIADSTDMSRLDAVYRIIGAITIALIGVTLLNSTIKKGTKA